MNNNQGPRPPLPGVPIPQTQIRPQASQNSAPSSSPFANPPKSTTAKASNPNNLPSSNNPMMNRPGNPQAPMRPPMPSQINSVNPSRPSMPLPRPPVNSDGAAMSFNSQAILGPPMPRPLSANRPPTPQIPHSSPGNRPPMPQMGHSASGNLIPSTSQIPRSSPMVRPPVPLTPPAGIRPPMPQIPSQSIVNRPPMSPMLQVPSVAPGQPASVSPNLVRPPSQSPQALNRPPLSQPPRPPMPQAPQAPSGGPFARPPPLPSGPQQAQMNRPSLPSYQAPSAPSMRPPIPSGPPAPMRPPMPTVPSSPILNGPPRPPMPMMPQVQQPAMGSVAPPSRYPPAIGYAQGQPQAQQHPGMQNQQPGYPQATTMPPTQHAYNPSYTQTTQQQPQGYAGGSSAAPQHPSAPKVNPAAIPSVVTVLEADENRFKETGQPFFTFTSVIDHPPPLPTTRSVSIIDDGNSSPQFIRPTLNHVPISEEICENSKIPLSLLIQPFATGPQTEVPLVDLGAIGPIRCNRCRAYINPHVQFIKGGRYFVCNMCDMSNDVPDEYYANLDMSGKRIDLDLRPELKFGTVDFVASKEYLNRPAGKPHLLFVLDSSRAAVGSGAFQASLESIKAFASSPQAVQYYGGMAILVQDRTLTFYTLREGRNEPQVLVVGDVFDPFVPLHANDLYFDPVKCASGLSVLLNHLSTNTTLDSRPVDSCFGAAVSAALDSLKVRGGRAVFFQTTLPSYGPGALKNREAGTAPAPADKANPLLFPQGDFYTKLANQAAEQGISMSLVATPAAHIDLATIGVLCNITSGTLLHYSRFSGQIHMNRVVGDVVGLLSSSFVFDCLARIRCNSGLQVKKHYGHFFTASNGHDLSFGTLSNDQSFAALLEYDGKLSEKERASFQIAFLHTDAFSGQRRIRILNLALPCTSSIQTIFRMAELDSILAFYLKKNISQILEAPSSAFPASFTSKCANILAAYRKYCAANMSSGQLILPDSLKLFPMMTLAIHKDPAFNDAPKSVDTRWHSIHRLSDMSLLLTVTHFYPQLFPLANVLEHEEVLPACIRLSREHLKREGIYLMNNGNTLTLYIGDSVDSSILKEIFGAPQLNAVNLMGSNLPILQNARSAKLRQIITVLRSQNSSRHLNLRLIRQSVDIAEDAEFASLLVEDASSLAPSYVDFLCRIHSTIQHTISQGASLSLAERTSILSFLQ